MKQLRKVTTVFDRTLDLLAALAGVLIVFMLLSVSAGVIGRYFIARPIPWVIEVNEFILLYITFLAAAWLLKREGHVKMDIVLSQLEPRTQALLNIITSVCCAVICLILVWYGTWLTGEYFQMGRYEAAYLNIPMAYVMGIIPLGSLLLFIQFLRRSYNYLGSWRTPSNKEEEKLEHQWNGR